ALGRSADGRVYAFVRTSEGKDLAELLIKAGLARTYGVGREGPDGTGRVEIKARLSDLEASAMLKNKGIWKNSDPDHIADFRADQRKEDNAIKESMANLVKPSGLVYPINLNSCSKEDLQTIRGIGPATAELITSHRPYKKLDDLLNVSGISTSRLESWRQLLTTE
ncbi:MAG: helix-hairpin-helix domain-containing protein, partial [Lentisphaerota bacterium]